MMNPCRLGRLVVACALVGTSILTAAPAFAQYVPVTSPFAIAPIAPIAPIPMIAPFAMGVPSGTAPRLVGADGTALGVLSTNPYAADSISNPYGQFGSKYSATSVNNPYSVYGSPYSALSATNPYTTTAPAIVAPNGQYLGQLSMNPYSATSTSNPYGAYGSPYSPTSVTNPYGAYAGDASRAGDAVRAVRVHAVPTPLGKPRGASRMTRAGLFLLCVATVGCDLDGRAHGGRLSRCPGVTMTTTGSHVQVQNTSRQPFDDVTVFIGGRDTYYRDKSEAIGGFTAKLGRLHPGANVDVTDALRDREGGPWRPSTMTVTSATFESAGVCESDFTVPAKP
jgi:hypothetical protein